jgi:hypothetical protein
MFNYQPLLFFSFCEDLPRSTPRYTLYAAIHDQGKRGRCAMDEPRGQTPTITHFYKILYSSIQHTPKFNWKALAMLRISSDFVLASCGRRCVFILIFDYINGYSVWFKKNGYSVWHYLSIHAKQSSKKNYIGTSVHGRTKNRIIRASSSNF